MSASAAAPMVGGAKFQQQVLEWTQQSNNLYLTVAFFLVFVWAIYTEKVPSTVRWQLNTTPGRLLSLLLLYVIHMLAGWIPALLFAIALALTWANQPLYKPTGVSEPFDNIKVTKPSSPRWFVEKALHEHPTKITQDRVRTSAVQDDSGTGSSRTSN
jgi:hypothetical protein